MFDEMENDKLERINDWFEGPWRFEYEVQKNIYFKRFEHFMCSYPLKEFKIRMSSAEKISKFVETLPLEWGEFLIELKKNFRISKFYLSEFVNELQKHEMEIKRKKKDLKYDIKGEIKIRILLILLKKKILQVHLRQIQLQRMKNLRKTC
ncbi:hypothetical protein Hanom_Chr09g00794121 [Helianthus anomalus]